MKTIRPQLFARAAAIVLLAALLPLAARAQFGGGTGSKSDPYIISSIEHMNELAAAVNGGDYSMNKYFRLDADLDYTGKTYNIIADNAINYNAMFSGIFNGNGHTISGVTLNRTSTNIGLFGSLGVGAVVENLTLSASTIRGRFGVGGIAGEMANFFQSSNVDRTTIRNCYVTSDVTIETVNMSGQISSNLGGIVGSIDAPQYSSVENCTSAATLIASSNSQCIGGVAGSLLLSPNDECSISGCVYTGSISGSSWVGGIVGEVDSEGNMLFTNNYIGGACTIGAFGVEGSSTGTDEGADTKRISTYRFASPTYDGGTCITTPTITIDGKDYFVVGDTIEFSELHTFGSTAAGKMWQFVAHTGDYVYQTFLATDHGTWTLTMLDKEMIIAARIVSDITVSNVSISLPDTLAFTGENVRPVITLWDSRGGKRLYEGTDFITNIPTEGYKDCGRYPVTIWGINNYGGRLDTCFVVAMPWRGKGTMAEPYLIYTTDDFDALSALTHKGYDQQGLYFRQMGTLDYTGKTFTPIDIFRGDFSNYSSGVFTGVNISGNVEHAALFGQVYAGGVVRNVYLENSTISSTKGDVEVGGIVGINEGEVSGCRASSGVTVLGVVAGGIVGQNQGSVTGCEFSGTVGYNDVTNSVMLGGIVGHNMEGEAQGTFFGTISAPAATNSSIGGIAGSNARTASGANFGQMNVGGTGNNVGGIVGENEAGSSTVQYSVSDCLMQNVSGTGNIGAIVGLNGQYQRGTVTNCYYIGVCKYGGINNADAVGQAQRGWPVYSTNEHITVSPDYSAGDIVGTYYDDGTNNYYYVGAGETFRFMLDNVIFSGTGYTANGTPLAVQGKNAYDADYYQITMPAGAVQIAVAALSLTLVDNDRYDYSNTYRINDAHDGNAYDVTLDGRTLYKDGEWNTLCLPFSLPTLTGTPLANAELMEIDATGTNGFDPATSTLHLTFKAATAIEAGKPYIIKWASGTDITSPTFSGVTITATTPATVRAQTAGFGTVEFRSVYTATYISATTDKNCLFLTAGNLLKYPEESRYLLPFRCYFHVDESVASSIRAFALDFGDGGTVTGIGAVSAHDASNAVFDLQGRRVAQPQKGGVYIIGGKKVVY